MRVKVNDQMRNVMVRCKTFIALHEKAAREVKYKRYKNSSTEKKKVQKQN